MKKFFLSYIFTIVLGTVLLILTAYILVSSLSRSSIVAPVPSFLNLIKNNQVSSLNIWIPILKTIKSGSVKKPEISAKSALVYDISEEKTLYEKNPKEKLPMASLTKIMTAIVAMENRKNDDKYEVTKDSLVGENSMGLSDGEILNINDLLYGLILPSGNDAAEVLAANFPGGRKSFINAMNNKTASLGLSDTYFTNPSGLEGDGSQHTTAYDLLAITKFALSNFPMFKEVVSTVEYSIPQTETHKSYYLYNETNLLTSYPGVKGVKTGFTDEANLCLVTYLDYQDHKIIGVLLGSNNRREEMKELLDYSLNSIGVKPPKHP